MRQSKLVLTRRQALKAVGGAAVAGLAVRGFPMPALAQGAPLRVGFMLPYTGTYAALAKNIDNAFRMYVAQKGDKLGGRAVEYVMVDDQAEPPKATENMNRLVDRDKVDVVVGTVHSGVQMAMVKIARETGKLLIIPNAGADAATRAACAPNVFRTSFSNWQPCYPVGKVMADAGHKTAMTITWKYAAGEEDVVAFKQGFGEHGGKVVGELWVPFPEVEFQSFLTQIAEKKPDGVFAFFAGGGAVKFVKDYAAAGLKKSIPLYGPGFLTDGTLSAQGEAAEGLKTTLHYADDLDNPADKAFRAEYAKRYGAQPDVYSVQGYDAAALLAIGMDAVKGDIKAADAMHKAMRAAKIDSPRGPLSFSASHNPIQNIYLREVKNGKNAYVKVAHAALADPGTGCKMT
ncbi:MAG TPA: ABC transporter substrate-binding protein [Xanthobacteraceae bacterium]|nr:ABC transporter substrate-binding protein [Xanthobacteraceae bacterium]